MARMTVTRINDAFAFNAVDEAHNSMILDIPVDQGGHGTGLRPMQTLLSALGACSGVDIVMILNKQKETIEFFEMVIDGERETGKEPALWTTVHIIFKFKGNKDCIHRQSNDQCKRHIIIPTFKFFSLFKLNGNIRNRDGNHKDLPPTIINRKSMNQLIREWGE